MSLLTTIGELGMLFTLNGSFVSINQWINGGAFYSKTSIEAIHGLMSQVIKNKLFNQVGGKEST